MRANVEIWQNEILTTEINKVNDNTTDWSLQVVGRQEENYCENAGNIVADHFRDVTKMVDIGSQTTREIDDIILTR